MTMTMESIDELRKGTPHWSYSSLNTYIQCPMKFRLRYLDNVEPSHTCSALPFGRAFHATLSERARRYENMSMNEVADMFHTYLKSEIDASINVLYKPDESFDSLYYSGLKMLELAMREWSDDYLVKSVAEAFVVNVPGLHKPLIGEFDCVISDAGKKYIVDWKTARAKWPEGKAAHDLQTTAFCYAYQKIYGTIPAFRFDVYTKSKVPTLTRYCTERDWDDLDRFANLIITVEKAVNTGIFYPVDGSFGCLECPYAHVCKNVTLKGD